MTKYEFKQQQKQERKEKREAKKAERREKKANKKANIHYGFWKRLTVKSLKTLSYIIWIGLPTYYAYKTFFVDLYTTDVINKIHLRNLAGLLFIGIGLFVFVLFALIRGIKKRTIAIETARNLGMPSKAYSPVVTLFIKGLMFSWALGLIQLFAYIAIQFGTSLNKALELISTTFVLGFVSMTIAVMYEQFTLTRIERLKRQSDVEHKHMVRDLHKELK